MMLAPQCSQNRDDMETRRLAAAQDLLNGVTQSQVARRHGVSRTTASRWHRSIVVKGAESLRKRRATGRPSRLTADQVGTIRQMFFEGAAAHGFSTDRWTTGKLAKGIERKFGIRYAQDRVGRLMHKVRAAGVPLPDAPVAATHSAVGGSGHCEAPAFA